MITNKAIKYHYKFDVMQFYCRYYVGDNLITSGENCYGNNPGEWTRLWVIKEPTKFLTHEPPIVENLTRTVSREETKSLGWVFDHYAYALEKQLEFKENYYGYHGAVNSWKKLQSETNFPVNLKDYFPWVHDHSQVIKIK